MNLSSESFSVRAGKYADAVIAGDVPACEHVKNACSRFLKDLGRVDDGELLFRDDEAERWCEFLEKLPHVKGKWAKNNETLKLGDWQIFCTVNIYGFYKPNGRRRFREVYIEVPRKNGKSFWTGGIGLGMLAIDGEHGAEIYCGATNEKQAWEIFRPAKMICEKLPKFREKYGVEVNAKVLNIAGNGSRFEPIIGDPGDGASPHFAIADEFHEHKNSDQVETMVTGMGARENPIMFYITTAGSDMGGPCYEKRLDVIQILKGAVTDDNIFGVIYTIDEDDEWDTLESQVKANPNFGISVDPEIREGELLQARRSPTKQVAYKTKYLNMWVGAKEAWMNMLAFQACRKRDLSLSDFKGRPCYIGIDLASKTDIADAAIYFPVHLGKKAAFFFKHYLPEDTIAEVDRYRGWHAAGWLDSTPGNVIDYSYIEDDLKELRNDFEIKEVPFDPFQATQFSIRMMEEGFPMIQYGATVKNFSEPMKELEAMILKKEVEFSLDPVLMWMMGNVVAQLDKKDNIFPNKERPSNKIDGVVAAIMALGRAIVQEKESTGLSDFLSNPVSI